LELAPGPDDEVVVFTMGPPSAADSLLEMIACGASRGVLVSDPSMVGSDTLVTARVLAAAILHQGQFDLILAGAYSVDSETGHVGAQLAECLGLPFVGPCHTLDMIGGAVIGTVESGGAFVDVEVLLPTVASVAERLSRPSKAAPEQFRAVPIDRITVLSARDLGLDPTEVGFNASPIRVDIGARVLAGRERGLLSTTSAIGVIGMLRDPMMREPADARALRGEPAPAEQAAIWCVVDPTTAAPDLSMLAAVEQLASVTNRPMTAVIGDAVGPLPRHHGTALVLSGPNAPEDWTAVLVDRLRRDVPHAVVIEGTAWGREMAARTAVRLGWGLVGDAVKLVPQQAQLRAFKAGLAGQGLVPVSSRSPTLLVTVRRGVLAGSVPVGGPPATVEIIPTSSVTRVIYTTPRVAWTASDTS
jgi:electron transfer flavoprotein alpha/beta subunit